MANNRRFLGCKICGEGHYLAKWYPGTPWGANTVEKRGAMFNEFLEKHLHYENDKRNDGDDGEYFELVYETHPTIQYKRKGEELIPEYTPIRECLATSL